MDDYKVVSGPLSVGASDGIRFDLFSLKHNSWRSTQHLGHSISFPAVVGAFLNGALHWLATRGLGSDKVNVIISFDLAEEVFREMPQPDLDHLRKSVHILGGFRRMVVCIQ
uniref:F-box associated beta-propeller type 1 domain-containing protein n=1 Tax=Davidia involucrata TaxID=16924 RepID=A0A5B7CBH7_DAVIN